MIKQDFRGKLFHNAKLIKLLLYKYLFTLINNIQCVLKKIEIGRKNIFYGVTNFNRKPLSSIKIGNNCDFRSIQISNLIGINRKCTISTLTKEATIIIGNNCGFSGTVIGAFSKIELGDNIRCGANTLITDSNWHFNDPRSGKPKPIMIQDNVWLGVNSIVLKGVTIGKNSVIGANSVVVNDIPDNVVASGNPCKIIRKQSLKEINFNK